MALAEYPPWAAARMHYLKVGPTCLSSSLLSLLSSFLNTACSVIGPEDAFQQCSRWQRAAAAAGDMATAATQGDQGTGSDAVQCDNAAHQQGAHPAGGSVRVS